jgi:hypothetical protein
LRTDLLVVEMIVIGLIGVVLDRVLVQLTKIPSVRWGYERKPLQLEKVSRSFGVVEVLRELSLEIRRGEFLAIVGPSGCGKTTLLNLLSGYDQPSSGLIKRQGRVRIGLSARGLFPWQTVSENIALGLRHLGNGQEQARQVAEMLRLIGSKALRSITRISFRAACGSAWNWRARSLVTRTFCCWTNHSRRRIIWPGCACGRNWRGCCTNARARWCWSHTTLKRPRSLPTA